MEAARRPETSSRARTGTEAERGAWWDRDREDADRARTLERLGAALSGFAELCYRRRAQQLRVRHALTLRSDAGHLAPVRSRETQNRVNGTHRGICPGMKEQLVEQNLLLLRKQLACLRRQDAELVSRVQEVGHQMNDLRLDAEESRDHETDSRASSGFFELSGAVSGSLSNSSNSVFSESLSSRPSSTCDSAHYHALGSSHYHTIGSSHYHTIGSSHCLLDGRLPQSDGCEVIPLFPGSFRRSVSAPHPPAPPSSLPSPLRTRDPTADRPAPGPRGPRGPAGPNPPLRPPVAAERHARLDGYIAALLRRRVPPPRPGRPRTSITTDPTLRQACPPARPPPGEAAAAAREGPNGDLVDRGCGAAKTPKPGVRSLGFFDDSSPPAAPPPKEETQEVAADSSPKRRSPRPPPYLSAKRSRLATPRKNHKPRPSRRTGAADSHPPQEGTGHMTHARAQAGSKHGRTGSKDIKAGREGNGSTDKEARRSEQNQRTGFSGSRRSRVAEDPGSRRTDRVPASIPEDRLLDKRTTPSRTTRGHRHHQHLLHQHLLHQHLLHSHRQVHLHHGRDAGVAVAQLRSRCKACCRRRATPDPPSEEARRPDGCGRSRPTSGMLECSSAPPPSSSTLMDASEEDHSNYTSNCFADQESCEEETTAGSSSCSDPEERGGGGGAGGGGVKDGGGGGEGAGGARGGGGGLVGRRSREAGVTQDLVKIKASRNLKKKLLHFRSGSLRLMTTV